MKYKISEKIENDLHIPKPQDLEVATYNLFVFLSSLLVSLGIFINKIQSFGFPLGVLKIYYDFLPFFMQEWLNTMFSHRKVKESWRQFSGRERGSLFLPFFPNKQK